MTKVKLADFVADFLVQQGVHHAFIVSGGASIHLLHAVAAHPDIEHICPHHEQAGAMAADAYARVTGNLGCAIATSGPGATNMITGIAGAWFDSIPVLYITGQVATFRMIGDTGVRQLGFQETEIIPMVRPITKYAAQVRDPVQILYELEKAVHIAKSGRPGPVLIDLPDDVQREFIDTENLPRFSANTAAPRTLPEATPGELDRAVALLGAAERPVVVLGWGVRLANGIDAARTFIEHLSYPVLTSWGARDILSEDHPLLAGTFGTHGTRAGNFVVQNADLVLSIGARLSTHETGSPMESWAREAKTIIVDIDPAELRKFEQFGRPATLPICADARLFAEAMCSRTNSIARNDIDAWKERIDGWRKTYPVCPPELTDEPAVNPYVFVKALSQVETGSNHIFIDTGCAVAWVMQGIEVSKGQRLYHDFNNTAMGWALPAAIAGSLATGHGPVSCIVGDGGMMMNLQELATVRRHNLPIRIFVLNNGGYSMIQQTQDQWLGSEYVGSSQAGGLYFPDFPATAAAFGIPNLVIAANNEIEEKLRQVNIHEGPLLVDVRIPGSHRVIPQSKFGYPIEDAEPLLPRDEFLSNMIVKPVQKSLEPIG